MAEVVNMKKLGQEAKQQAAAIVAKAAGAVGKADAAVKIRERIATRIEESDEVQSFIKDLLLLPEVGNEIKVWMMTNNVKQIRSTDGTVKFTLQDAVYGIRPITEEEQKRLNDLRAPVQRTSLEELLKMDPELAAQMADEAHRTEAPIKKAYVKCQDQRASLTELNEVCERVVAIEENRRLYKPEPQ